MRKRLIAILLCLTTVWAFARPTVGNFSNSPFLTSGKFNVGTTAVAGGITYSLSTLLDGVDESITFTHNAAYDFDVQTEDFTLSIWFKWAGTVQNHYLFSKVTAPVRGYGFAYNSTDKVDFWVSNASAGGKQVFARTTVAIGNSAGEWHLFTAGVDGTTVSTVTIWVDTSSKALSVITDGLGSNPTDSGEPLNIGMWAGSFVEGNVLQGMIFNKKLSQAEVEEIYNSGTALDPTTLSFSANLVHAPPLGHAPDSATDADGYQDLSTTSEEGSGVNLEAGDIEADVP